MDTESEDPDDYDDSKYLIFSLDKNDYGIPILKVSEIIGLTNITPIPKVPSFIKGIINLRGSIIPVMDLRLKLGLPEKEYDHNTCIVILNKKYENTVKKVGIIVDIVSEVCAITSANIERPPDYGSCQEDCILSGVGKIKNEVVILLDIERTIFTQELHKIAEESEMYSTKS